MELFCVEEKRKEKRRKDLAPRNRIGGVLADPMELAEKRGATWQAKRKT
jgi:hypothetical protein